MGKVRMGNRIVNLRWWYDVPKEERRKRYFEAVKRRKLLSKKFAKYNRE